MKRTLVTTVTLALAMMVVGLPSSEAITPDEVMVKKAIAERMTPEQLAAHKADMAARVNAGLLGRAPGGGEAPGDTCTAATPEVGPLPFGPAADTTVGAVDDFDLPATVVAPTCTAPTNCTGAGQPASLPRGSIYTGTGTGPDRAYSITTDANCDLTINMTAAADLGLIIYQSVCSSLLSDCVCVDDTGFAGATESVLLNAIAGTNYFAVTDGYGGASSAYTLGITGAGCSLVPVELLDFTIS